MTLAHPPAPQTGRRIEATNRRVVVLAVPMMLSHVTEPLLGLVNAVVIGRLGDAALLGAVALGAVIFDFLFWGFGALRLGTAGLTAQAYGAGDDVEVEVALARALTVGTICGVALVALQVPVMAVTFALVGASDAVTEATRTYLAIRIWSAPFALANFAILGSVIGRARTDLGLLLQVVINIVNMVVAIVLVLVFGLGVAGAALAAVAAEIVGVVLGLVVLARLGARPWTASRIQVFDRAAMRRTLAVNTDIMIRTIAISFAFAFFTSQGARAGDTTLAANAVLYNMFMIGAFFLDGFATAAEQLCGQALGGRDEGGFRRVVRLALGWSIVVGAAVSAGFLAGGELFIDLVSTNEGVRAEARAFLIFAALTPLAGAAAFAYDGIYSGATWTAAMRNLMLIAVALFLVLVWLMAPQGNTGLWVAMLIFLAARGIGQALLFPRLTRRAFASS
jgi:multidrug resistance protein, MATE family